MDLPMPRWGFNLYHYLKNHSGGKLKSEAEEQINKKLFNTLLRASRNISFYKSYKNIPFLLWPIVDENMINENKNAFQISNEYVFKDTINRPATLSKQELAYYQQCFKQNEVKFFQNDLLGFYCKHQNLCFPKALYYMENAWVDESHSRFVPIVTTITRKKNIKVRFRLNYIFNVANSKCACEKSNWLAEKFASTADEILYLPHLFDKRSLPIFKDEIVWFFKQFSSIQVLEIVQQSMNKWCLVIGKSEIDLAALHNEISIKLEKYLMFKQMKCPNIQVKIDTLRTNVDAIKISKVYDI